MARLFFSFVKTSLYINFVYCKESLVLLQGISRLIARNLSSYCKESLVLLGLKVLVHKAYSGRKNIKNIKNIKKVFSKKLRFLLSITIVKFSFRLKKEQKQFFKGSRGEFGFCHS